MSATRLTILMVLVALCAACSKEPPPRTVTEFIDNPLLLEAALVRCTQNRAETRYEVECVNAREAVKLIEAKEEAARRVQFEEQSRRKREALRRTQRAAAEARRRTADARRRQEEAEYLAQFGELPPAETSETGGLSGNLPGAVLPDPEDTAPEYESYDERYDTSNNARNDTRQDTQYDTQHNTRPDETFTTSRNDANLDSVPVTNSNAPAVEVEPEPEPEVDNEEAADLSSIRDELRRRSETTGED